MHFEKALYDNSDPTYAPLMSRSKDYFYWKPSKRFNKFEHGMTPQKLEGKAGDGLDLERAAECRRLTRMLVERCDADGWHPINTWGWLIHHYRTDSYSPFQNVKANTKSSYTWMLDRWDKAIGHLPIKAMTFQEIKKTEASMRQKGRSPAYVHRMFTMMRGLVNYGRAALDSDQAAKVSEILSLIEFPKGAPRTVFVTREQITAIIAEADNRGMEGFACGLMMQWVFALRAVDVRGQWFEIEDESAGGIIRETFRTTDGERRRILSRWQDGLTWDMVAPDFSSLTKVISKTVRSMPEPLVFNLTQTPALRERLRRLSRHGMVGPVIQSNRGPYTVYGWSQAFSRIRDDLGLPKEITAQDIRAGALSEAKKLGLNPTMIRDAAGHANISTTSRYMRDRSSGANEVVKLRGGK